MKFQRSFDARIRSEPPGPHFRVSMSWDSDDPLAAVMTFPSPAKEQRWVFARELIGAGLKRYTGDAYGDVHVWPDKDKVVISLRPREERADVECPKAEVQAFYDATVVHTPVGAEQPRIDAAIENLIDSIRERGA